jgi:translation elongation factor EF-Ts
LPRPQKKAGRIAAEGMVYAEYCEECKVGVAIEVNAETDFVAKNEKFVDFVKEVTAVIMQENPADVEALMACKTGRRHGGRRSEGPDPGHQGEHQGSPFCAL